VFRSQGSSMTVFASTPRVRSQPRTAAPVGSRGKPVRKAGPAATPGGVRNLPGGPGPVDRADVDRADVDRADVDRADVGRADVDPADVDLPALDLGQVDFGEYGLGGTVSSGAALAGPERDALATEVMDLYRRTRCREVFDSLVELTRDQMLARVRSRVRFLGQGIDPHELLQDAYINIY